jgi:uncharacterized protein YkwD
MRKFIFFIFLLFFVAGCGQQILPPANLNELMQLHNDERLQRGLHPLEMDEYLNSYAQKHAEWMARKNSMTHSDVNALMGKYHTAGENIAWNQKDEPEVVDAWMHSRGHRANILNKNFGKAGFGMSRNSRGQPYWCTVFAD